MHRGPSAKNPKEHKPRANNRPQTESPLHSGTLGRESLSERKEERRETVAFERIYIYIYIDLAASRDETQQIHGRVFRSRAKDLFFNIRVRTNEKHFQWKFRRSQQLLSFGTNVPRIMVIERKFLLRFFGDFAFRVGQIPICLFFIFFEIHLKSKFNRSEQKHFTMFSGPPI